MSVVVAIAAVVISGGGIIEAPLTIIQHFNEKRCQVGGWKIKKVHKSISLLENA
jgi:hypothetical protein